MWREENNDSPPTVVLRTSGQLGVVIGCPFTITCPRHTECSVRVISGSHVCGELSAVDALASNLNVDGGSDRQFHHSRVLRLQSSIFGTSGNRCEPQRGLAALRVSTDRNHQSFWLAISGPIGLNGSPARFVKPGPTPYIDLCLAGADFADQPLLGPEIWRRDTDHIVCNRRGIHLVPSRLKVSIENGPYERRQARSRRKRLHRAGGRPRNDDQRQAWRARCRLGRAGETAVQVAEHAAKLDGRARSDAMLRDVVVESA